MTSTDGDVAGVVSITCSWQSSNNVVQTAVGKVSHNGQFSVLVIQCGPLNHKSLLTN